MDRFRLTDNFIEQYKNKEPAWGFNGLGKLVYYRTYSRTKESGEKEDWWETVKRVVEGTYNMQKRHVEQFGLGWNANKAQSSAQDMYDRIFNFKFLPPGRGLWAMGSDVIEERGLYAALNNCGFHSTEDIDKEDPSDPFCFLFDMCMVGAGIGFDVKGEGKITIQEPDRDSSYTYTIPDSREGWVESLRLLLNSYFKGEPEVHFDYSEIRPPGEPIRGFGGVASGYKPLEELHEFVRQVLEDSIGNPISGRNIVDIMNKIGTCVVAGNIRRSSEIVFGDPNDEEYINLKNYDKYPERMEIGWASNNSVFADTGMDYSTISERIRDNGEPGVMWLTHAQDYGRMVDPPDYKDYRASGGNPCVTGDTPILTDKGYIPISEVIGKDVNVWNGEEFSRVTPFSTGINDIVEISFSDGTSLEVTPYHEFIIRNGRSDTGYVVRKQARDLKVGDKLEKFSMPVVEDGDDYTVDAYSQGFYSGDGNRDYTYSFLYSTKYCCQDRLIGRFSKEYEGKRKQWTHGPMYDKRFVPVNGSLDYCINWLAGLFDADGTVTRDKNGNGLQLVSVDEKFLLDLKLMLSRLGVRAKVIDCAESGYRSMPDGRGGTQQYFCNKTKRILIGNTDTHHLVKLGLSFNRLDVHSNPPQRDARQFVRVMEIKYTNRREETFCFTEPKANRGTFNGVVTGQCLEQTLESGEMCTLVESFPNNHDSLDDYLKTLKMAYLYAKTVTLGKIHWTKTNRIQMRNRRIGCSVTGVAQFLANRDIETLREWLDTGYKEIQRLDQVYSEWLAIPRSIKTTSVKPSGSVSLLAGATPGAHFPHSRYYIRRVRLAKNSELVPALEEAGFHVEPAVGQERDTVVVEFPVDVGEGVRTANEVSMWEQLSVASFLQKWWADNQVSYTVSFDPDTEGDQIEPALDHFQYGMKGVSMLPISKDTYPQMPYEEITKEEYDSRLSNIREIDFSCSTQDAMSEKFCDGDTCNL